MSDFNFTLKEGDFVYIPSAYSTPQKVKSIKGTNLFKVDYFTFFDSGYLFQSMTNPAGKIIFPAMQEWYEKLVVIYPNLEKPPKRKSSKEIIQAMLDSGKWYLVNYRICTNTQQILSNKPKNKVITKQQFNLMNYDEYFNRYAYCNIEVICPNTGKVIIDYVNGEVILEG